MFLMFSHSSFCAIVWNTDITHDIYHFNHKSQYVVKLLTFLFLQYNLYVYIA